MPAPGKLSEGQPGGQRKAKVVTFPDQELARTETWVEAGSEVTPYYDPMIAKIIVTQRDRADAVSKMALALEEDIDSWHGDQPSLS